MAWTERSTRRDTTLHCESERGQIVVRQSKGCRLEVFLKRFHRCVELMEALRVLVRLVGSPKGTVWRLLMNARKISALSRQATLSREETQFT